MEPLFTAADVSQHLGVATSTVYAWFEEGRLKGLKLGRLVRFRETDVKDFLDAAKQDRAKADS
jgi:excisionase family DNA binding protein